MNPRVLAWLAAVGLEPKDIARPSGADVPQVTIDGEKNLWTVHYTSWIWRQWREWAASLGFTRGSYPCGSYPWEQALLAGHTQAEFDAYLAGEPR